MSTAPATEATRPAVRMHQTHDASGAPAPAEFLEILPTNAVTETVGSSAMRFLATLNPRRADRENTFFYSDPARGSGWLQIEGFRPSDADRVYQLVRMEEIVRVVGPEPRKNPDYLLGNAFILRSNNPWIMIALGVVIFGLSLYGLSYISVYPHLAWLYIGLAAVLMGLAITIWVVLGRQRVGWWHRARRSVRETGETMPDDLRIWS